MALLWQKKVKNRCYEIRTAGNSIRLYTDGIFHSQWNPEAPLAGNLWDLLVLPAFLQSKPPAHCAVLGVGGGAIINQLRYFFHRASIVGVDLDVEHLKLARRFFNVKGKGFSLLHQDARLWVENALHKRQRFDYLVEDLFCAEDSPPGTRAEPVRAVEASAAWVRQLTQLLTDSGTLVMNFESVQQCRSSEGVKWACHNGFSRIFALSRPMYQNVIAVLCKGAPSGNQHSLLVNSLENAGALPARHKSKILQFHIYRIR